MLTHMCDNIPEEHDKPLYYALFESHMTYCITKPLFNKLEILAFSKFIYYQICLETLKTVKSRTPQSLFQLYMVSTRNNQLFLRARADDTPYIKSRVNIWKDGIIV